jgi:hypothetical protein
MVYFFCKRFVLLAGLFYLTSLSLVAQETDFLKDILRESLKPEFALDRSLFLPDTSFAPKIIVPNPIMHPLPIATYNHRFDSLFNAYQAIYKEDQPLTIAPYMYAPYTNQSIHTMKPTEASLRYQPETPRPIAVASNWMINPVALTFLLLKVTGALPETSVLKKNDRQKKVKTITRDVYHIDDGR